MTYSEGFSDNFKALQQELSLVSAMLCEGLNKLHKANYTQKGVLLHIFF